MTQIPKIFISATSADLAHARQIVKEALLKIGCHPVEQRNFPPDWRNVKQMLYDKISNCQAIIHIVGYCYGNEPDPATVPENCRRSFTQIEYDIGNELQIKYGGRRFRVYTFICPENFPYLPLSNTEEVEKRELQKQHRNNILSATNSYHEPKDLSALEALVLTLREDVLLLRARQKKHTRLTLYTLAAIALTLIIIGYGVYQIYIGTSQSSRTDVLPVITIDTLDPIDITYNKDSGIISFNDNTSNAVVLSATNIGNGPARNIKIKWNVSLDNVNKVFLDSNLDYSFHKSPFPKLYSMPIKGSGPLYIPMNNPEQIITYLSPNSEEDRELVITIPLLYYYGMLKYAELSNDILYTTNYRKQMIPIITLSYDDILGNNYATMYEIKTTQHRVEPIENTISVTLEFSAKLISD
ncbi:MAG: DUF4062 domain-containing protein [Candidatus Thiodiazotropha taylori]|uniref:DUF4062 domain-containing protein n=1 Tax=Candidatus Thiodiazotropha taylori TaxID=2792791 RepID=A0A9E4N7X3_9GAMM|nr:DUF4062 domain-containing protein [Candidatus Thiodiazotropha taylori]MCW4259303.1 DUF4062 domain-containing protein [Candidatus Thiodiazotropha taylori]